MIVAHVGPVMMSCLSRLYSRALRHTDTKTNQLILLSRPSSDLSNQARLHGFAAERLTPFGRAEGRWEPLASVDRQIP